MAYRITYRPEADAELDQLLTHISQAGGWPVANAYVGGILELVEGLRTFPQRGTERIEILPGLRIIGYRRSASIAFVVRDGGDCPRYILRRTEYYRYPAGRAAVG